MTDKTLGISVKATADFSDVTRAGAKAAADLRAKLGGATSGIGATRAPTIPFLGKQIGQPDPLKAVDSLQKALDRTAQAGKRLRDIRFPSAQFSEAAKQVQALERRIAMMHMTGFGKDLRGRLAGAGADLGRPFDWDWQKLYGGQQAGQAAREKFFRGAFAAPPAPPARIVAPVVAAPGGGGSGGGGLLAGVGGLARIIPQLAVLATAAKGIQMMSRGYDDHLKVIESVDSIYKGMASERGFKGLAEDARTLGNALQLTSVEASGLAKDFVAASGATDATAFERAGVAGQFGRGYGMDPNAATGLFARAGLVGVGNERSSQREFARTIAETIGGSGMFTRADQVMGDMVERIEKVATSQGRTSGAGEWGAFSSMLQGLYANPAMRGGGAQSVISALDAAGGRGGEIQEMFAWAAFGDAVGMDAARMRLLQESGAETSPYDLFGDKFTKTTRAELAHDTLKRLSHISPGETERERYAYTASEYGYSTSQIALQQYDLMEGLKKSGNTYSGFASWLPSATGKGADEISYSGMHNLSRLFGKKGDRSDDHVSWMRSIADQYRKGGNLPEPLAASLKDALAAGGDPDKLETLLPKIIAATDAMGTAADKERTATGRLATEFESLASVMHPMNLAMKEVAINGASAANALRRLTDELMDGPPQEGPTPRRGRAGRNRRPGWTPDGEFISPPASVTGGSPQRRRGPRRGSSGASSPLDAIIAPAGASVVPKPAGDTSPAAAMMSGGGAYPYQAEISASAAAHGVSEWALAGIISQESNFGKNMVGDNGASVGFGHFNVNGALADFGLTREELLAKSAAEQIDLVAKFLAMKKKQAKGNERRAIELYNGGGDPNYFDNVQRKAREAGFGVQGQAGASPAGAFGMLDPEFSGGLQRMIEDAKAAGHDINLRSGFRTYDEQAAIYERAKRKYGADARKWAAPAGYSSHNTGMAADLKYSSDAARQWAHDNAEAYGMQFRMGHEPWHIEPKGFHPSQHPLYGKKPPEGWTPDQGIPGGPDLGQASPKMPPALFAAIAPNSPNQPNDARWQGQVAMDLTIRTDRGAQVKRMRSLAVSEPRVAGSGGSAGDSSRFSWNDSVTLPAIG